MTKNPIITPAPTGKLSGAGLALISVIAWGGMFPVVKSALPVMDAFYLTLIRYAIAAVILAGLLLVVEGARAFSFEERGWQLVALGAAGFAGFGLLSFVALHFIKPQNAALIMATMPLITALITAARKRVAPPYYTIAAIGLALLGVALVITKGDPAVLLNGSTRVGHLMALGGATSWVIYSMGGAAFPTWSPLRYTTVTAGLGTLTVALATAIATAVGYIQPTSVTAVAAVIPQIAYLVVFASVIGVFTWNVGLKRLGAQNGILFINLVPVTAFCIAVAGGYQPNGFELLGAAITLAALIGNNIMSRRITAR